VNKNNIRSPSPKEMDFFLVLIWKIKNNICTFVEEKNKKMEGQEKNDTKYQELEMVYSPILGTEYILVDVEETEEKE
jgi:hypothetical protein